MVQVGVYGKWECLGGVNSILERINCILPAYSVNFNSKSGRIYGYMGENTTFGRVVWAVGQISRSDLVQVGVYGKWECLGGVHSILERINSILIAYSVNFNSKSGRIYGYMGENTTFGSVYMGIRWCN